MKRQLVTVSGRQVHYRVAGHGAPVVMLHPSPLSSAAVLPVAQGLARHFRVYALDTPGYGLSDPLPVAATSLDEYVAALAETLDALGLGRICLYGAATGAQVGIEFAKRHPDRVALLVLDAAGHFPAEMCERVVPDYFPDVSPKPDGRHLVTLWQMVRDLSVFFPWCDARAATRVERDLPPAAAIHAAALDYLRAGTDYAMAYRPAFYNERAERAREVKVPAVIVRWRASLVLPMTDDLIAAGLPANFSVLDLGPTQPERIDGIAACVVQRWRGDGAAGATSATATSATAGPAAATPATETSAAAAPAAASPATRLSQMLLETSCGQLHALARPAGTGRPLLLLHSATGSAATMRAIAEGAAASRPVLALSLPGHGESEPFAAGTGVSIEAYAAAAAAALDAAGLTSVDVAGERLGALVGLALRTAHPRRVNDVTYTGRLAPVRALAVPYSDEIAPSLAPEVDGTHLMRTWYMMRDAALWYPWNRRTRDAMLRDEPHFAAAEIHRRVVELAKLGDRYRDALRAELTHPADPAVTALAPFA